MSDATPAGTRLVPQLIINGANECAARGTLSPYWQGKVYDLCREVTRLRAVVSAKEVAEKSALDYLRESEATLARIERMLAGRD